MTLRFGTDGVRGVANRDLTPELLVALGRAAARVLGTDRPFLVGRDTRRSGPFVESALVAGLTAAGCDAELVGVLPTPGIAFLSATEDVHALVISASHNPFTDNGVKIFARGGRKLSDDDQARIEAELMAPVEAPAEGDAIGTVLLDVGGAGRYVMHLAESIGGRRLAGLHVVVDCANGAGFEVAPSALRELGLRVDVCNADPDGVNINDGCGSTAPDGLRAEVVARGADAGIALDGDADRLVAVDETGDLVDGDQLLAVLAVDRHDRGMLRGDAVVATVMSNLGLRRALSGRGIGLVEVPVGDRNVLNELARRDLSLGGEQSGHIVVGDLATTGDGTLTGILVLDVMARTGRRLSELASVMTRVPQVLRNVPTSDPVGIAAEHGFQATLRAVEDELGLDGRVLVRPSGTESMLRLMVEAPETAQAETLADRLVVAATAAGS